MNMITAYYRFAVLPEEVRAVNGIRCNHRYDCIASYNPTGYALMKVYQNAKGMATFYLVHSHDMVRADSKRRATYVLSNGKQNLSSLFYEEAGLKGFFFGYCNGKSQLNNGQPNPAYPYRNDAFLFLWNQVNDSIELLVIEGGKPYIDAHFYQLIDGNLDEELNRLRLLAGPYYNYKGL